jgi:hypothetical protein
MRIAEGMGRRAKRIGHGAWGLRQKIKLIKDIGVWYIRSEICAFYVKKSLNIENRISNFECRGEVFCHFYLLKK